MVQVLLIEVLHDLFLTMTEILLILSINDLL